jgi:hypothetical protein
MRYYDVPVNQSISTEANRGLTFYTSRTAYKIISYLVAKCVAEVGYLCVIVLSFYVGVSNLLLKARVEGYEGLIFLLAYRV